MGSREWFCRKNKIETVLFWCVIVLVLVIVVLFLCLLIARDNEICTNPECIRGSVHILDTVDPEADPCEDFYKFACGKFMKQAFLHAKPSGLYDLNELTKNQLKQIVVEDDREDMVLPRTVVYQRKFYQACMDSDSIEKHKERIYNIFDEVVGGWPILKMVNWPEENFNWRKAMITARKLGLYFQFFLRVDVYRNYTNDRSLLWIRPVSDHEIKSFHFNDSSVAVMQSIAKELGANSVDVRADLHITNTFAEQLKHIAAKRNNETLAYGHDKRFNISIKDISHKLVKFDWVDFLWELTGIHVSEKDRVVFDAKDYLTDLYYLFHRTPKKIQANYIAWILLVTNINYLPYPIRNMYNKILEDDKPFEIVQRHEQCYTLSRGLFRMVAEAEYVRRYTTKEKKEKITLMVDYIKKEMAEAIKSSEWMDDKSRANAFNRLKNITTYIGWLDVAFNITKLEDLSGLNKIKHFPENGAAIDMARIALKSKYDKMYSLVRRVLDELEREDISTPRIEVNAYFLREYNMLILPTPIIQEIIFDLKRPYYMNFGALGSVIGHELIHGFSIIHEPSDEDGLWTNETLEKRGEMIECIQNEYNSFRTDRGKEADNATSTEENVADFNGVNLAYNAYRKWIRTYGSEPALPGVPYTPNQMFWIMASTYMCYEPQFSEKDTVIGKDKYHGTPEFRVVGRIKNSPYFGHDFNCQKGSKMNPEEKCRIFS